MGSSTAPVSLALQLVGDLLGRKLHCNVTLLWQYSRGEHVKISTFPQVAPSYLHTPWGALMLSVMPSDDDHSILAGWHLDKLVNCKVLTCGSTSWR